MGGKKRRNNKAIDVIQRVVQEVELVKPSREQIVQDLKMMSFKVRPITGDIFTLKREEEGLLKMLWRVGKIEEILENTMPNLHEREQELVLKYLNHMEMKEEERARQAVKKLSPKTNTGEKKVTLEIFKTDNPSDDQPIN